MAKLLDFDFREVLNRPQCILHKLNTAFWRHNITWKFLTALQALVTNSTKKNSWSWTWNSEISSLTFATHHSRVICVTAMSITKFWSVWNIISWSTCSEIVCDSLLPSGDTKSTTEFSAKLEQINVNNCPKRCDYLQFIYCRKLLYMFPVITSSIIRSTCKL